MHKHYLSLMAKDAGTVRSGFGEGSMTNIFARVHRFVPLAPWLWWSFLFVIFYEYWLNTCFTWSFMNTVRLEKRVSADDEVSVTPHLEEEGGRFTLSCVSLPHRLAGQLSLCNRLQESILYRRPPSRLSHQVRGSQANACLRFVEGPVPELTKRIVGLLLTLAINNSSFLII